MISNNEKKEEIKKIESNRGQTKKEIENVRWIEEEKKSEYNKSVEKTRGWHLDARAWPSRM